MSEMTTAVLPTTRPRNHSFANPVPQSAPGASAAIGHDLGNSIPLSIFPIATDKFAFAFCGMPGRGKTHIARRVARYLEFFWAVPVKVFVVSEYRRTKFGAVKDSEWFDSSNEESYAIRQECNKMAVNDMVAFLDEHENGIAILDSTNSSHARRKMVDEAVRSTGASLLWIEVISDNTNFLIQQVRTFASTSPDYVDMTQEAAEMDYRKRLDQYAATYEPLGEPEEKWSYFKCDHSKHHFVSHRVRGHLPLKVVHFIMNLRNSSHAFFLSRHGQSEYNAIGRIGGDSGISEFGIGYAHKLAEFVETNVKRSHPGAEEVAARLWTSNMRRTKETAQFIKQNKITVLDMDDASMEYEWVQMRPRVWHHLDELFAGSMDGMTYEEIELKHPEEWKLRKKDKLAYRYPRGESYLDVIARLEPIILEMERHREPLLVVAHQAILRVVYAFYADISRAEAPYVSIPLNTVVEMQPHAFGCHVKRHVLYTPPKPLISDGQDEPQLDDNREKDLRHDIDPPSH